MSNTSLESGVYTITSSVSPNPAIDLEGGNAVIANIIAYKLHGGKNQQWKVEKLTRGEYSIKSMYQEKSWISMPAAGDPSAQLTSSLYDPAYAGNTQSRWKIVQATPGNNSAYLIYSVLDPNKVFDLQASVTKDLTPILNYAVHKGPNQVWLFKKV